MESKQAVLLFLCTGLCTAIFVYGFRILINAVESLFKRKNRLAKIIQCIVYLLLLFGLGYLLPDDLTQSTSYYAIWLSFGFILWLSFINTTKHKRNFGELLFKSRHLSSKISYITVPFVISMLGFSIVKCISILTDRANVPQGIQDLEVDYKVYYLILLVFALSTAIYIVVSSWRKLEIRQQGLVALDNLIKWENIISYSWSGKKQDLLEIEYQARNQKTQKSKIAVAVDEKENIEAIFNNQQINQNPA